MKIIFSDFDGTLTHNRMLGSQFFDILNLTHKNNAEFIVVTGRSISWGHFLLTHFPMSVVITEGGGAILLSDNKGNIKEELLISENDQLVLDEITMNLMQQFPGCPLSVDSFGRKTDRAIEFLGQDEKMIDEIKLFLCEKQVNFNQSDVHINFWLGDHTKYTAVEKFLYRYRTGVGLDNVLYFGDSLNDESMFEKLPHTVGVSNIESVLGKLKHHPKVILKGEKNIAAKGVLNYLKTKVFIDNSAGLT
ncbi:MAG: HAD family phosphatase [Bacteriovoracaceae bacterium]|nr:HAD family phosphatase [Bacteriovoracaceae bacterium]